jgi:AcrR family transcriptional regulator
MPGRDTATLTGLRAEKSSRVGARTVAARLSVSDFQRSRLLRAALEVVGEEGYWALTASAVIARARVSRKTFYELFDSREDCLVAVLEDSFARIAAEVAPAYEAPGGWAQRLRAALVAVLGFLERERETGAFVVSYLGGCGPEPPELRMRVLEQLQGIVDEGRTESGPRHDPAPLTAEFVVGGVLSVLYARLRSPKPRLMALASPLMWTIVLPYRGPAAAAMELKRPTPTPRETRSAVGVASAADSLSILKMRLTYRTGRVLEVIGAAPGRTNNYVGEQAGITDPGQISKLLTRLTRLGLVENTGPGHELGGPNAWWLTPTGEELESAIRRRALVGGR